MIWAWAESGSMAASCGRYVVRLVCPRTKRWPADEWLWFVLESWTDSAAQAVAWGSGYTKAEVFHACMAELYRIADRSAPIVGWSMRRHLRDHRNADGPRGHDGRIIITEYA